MTTIAPLDFEQLPEQLQELFRARFERLGYLGDFFRYTAHQPAALAHFFGFTEALKESLPADLVETVSLTAASRLDNRYERHQHEQLSKRLGFPRTWIRALVEGDLEHPGFTPEQKAARALTVAVIERQGAAYKLDELVNLVGQETAVAVLLLCARYIAHAAVANALGLEAPVPSIFEPRP